VYCRRYDFVSAKEGGRERERKKEEISKKTNERNKEIEGKPNGEKERTRK
jgi:hypothetical protein